MVHGGPDTVNFLCDAPSVRAISFVGGDRAGEHIFDRGGWTNIARTDRCDHVAIIEFDSTLPLFTINPWLLPPSLTHSGTKNGKRVQANLGAKNHATVMPDATREATVNAIVGAAFGAAGQRCMALSTVIFVGESADWLPDLVERARTLRLGSGLDPATDIGPLISVDALRRAEQLIQAGRCCLITIHVMLDKSEYSPLSIVPRLDSTYTLLRSR